ncbi:MAG: isoleucyl-tRNA synthetase [Myxococcota bacterium]|jgi:isoleucyl-tRNA synthetase
MFDPVDSTIDFPSAEKLVLKRWKEQGIFEKSMELRKGSPSFVFFEGPPTANGTPHNGHVLTRVIKDLFPRYKTMRGYHVARKAGWDTHGLPVEVEVEKELGIHGKSEIEKVGIEEFTKRCLESVFRYTDVWQELTERIGFWIDLDDAYVTFHKSYVESVWWALSTLFNKGLLYKGHKVVWWWPQGGTALSSGEVGQGYKTVDDPSVTVKFALKDADNTYFLAWTTTPWTLPSNCAMTVSAKLDYVYAVKGDETYILAEALADAVLGEGEYTVTKTVKGSELLGLTYEPLFNYAMPEEGTCHVVIAGDFVTTSAGTGVVHTAPAFGEDDSRVAKKNGVGVINLIKPDGTFVDEATDFAGLFCKKADRPIIKHLKAAGMLFAESTVRHEYPFCWRAKDDPLIQYARPAWFIRTTDVVHRAIETNQKINWLPEHIKDGRFGDFLDNNVDWALSRERFWGTPLPIWECHTCETRWAADSTKSIEAKNPDAFKAFYEAQKSDPNLSEHLMVHKPWIDGVTVPCECGAEMVRVTEVIDCWFDSGCMPFAQWGYPHQGKEQFKASWPADFISEGIDQTRGWFYSLLMVSTLLFEEAQGAHPYKTCIVLGHIADRHGKKESKSLGNYTPPTKILDTNGADAMRWYFYSANPPYNSTRYSPEAVRQSQQEFLLKLNNVYSFFVIYANIDGFDPQTAPKTAVTDRPLIDRWIISELQLTLREVTERMDKFHIYESAQRVIELTDALSNWYVRRCRDRFWSSDKNQDKWDAYHTLHEVLTTMCQMIAPFVPFIAETIYQNLAAGHLDDARESVHLTDWPGLDEALIDEALSEEMGAVRDVVSLGLSTRGMHKLKVRQPLQAAEIILGRAHLEERLRPYVHLIAEELNVKDIQFTQDAGGRVRFEVKPNFRALGPRFGKRMPLVSKAFAAADPAAIRNALASNGTYPLTLSDGETVELDSELVQVNVAAEEGYAASGGSVGTVILTTELTDALIAEGRARELTSRIQAMRKEAKLDFTARIHIELSCDADIKAAAESFGDTIAQETLATALSVVDTVSDGGIQQACQVDKRDVTLRIEVAK